MLDCCVACLLVWWLCVCVFDVCARFVCNLFVEFAHLIVCVVCLRCLLACVV